MADWLEKDLERLVGQRVRAIRERKGWSQTELAERSGLGAGRQSTMAKIEAGQRPLRINEAVSLAEALGVPLLSLIETHPSQEVGRAAAALEKVQLIFEDIEMRRHDLRDELRELDQLHEQYAAQVATAQERLRVAREVELSGQPGEEG